MKVVKTYYSNQIRTRLVAPLRRSLRRSLSAATLVTSLVLPAVAAPAPAPIVTGVIDPVSGFQTLSGTLRRTYSVVNGIPVPINPQTTVASANLTVAGVSRRYLVIKPTNVTANAPVMLFLHANSVSPELMAALTEAADYAATQGFWAVFPAAVGGVWKDDPSTSGNDDVRFVSALIDTLATQGADATRVYAAGYSNGGFMADRLACELSDKIAAFGMAAASLRNGVANACAPVKKRAKIYFLGTADGVVPYAGVANLKSASATMAYWSAQQGCAGTLANTLPDRVLDVTTVQQTRYTGCVGGAENQLYTITGGGHAWPGGLTASVDITTMDVDATGLIWKFASAYRR